jgi:TfoX/Sxy family transcriptional regulator of competence genes/predicted nucleotidyltransferase
MNKQKNNNYTEYIIALLEPLGHIKARKMFGGFGIYQGDIFFALIANDTLYFKVDDNSRPLYESYSSKPFFYEGKDGKRVTMSYWEVPVDIFENSPKLAQWVEQAVNAATQSKKPAKKNEVNFANLNLDAIAKKQIHACLKLLKQIFGQDLLGIYLYGSSVLGGLAKYSDIDLFVVSKRATTREEKAKLATALLKISGIYMKSKKRPIEITIVEKAEINPWRYPPKFDFQYGDWLRKQFELGDIEPWPSKEMPDLALLITQILLASHTLVGTNPDQLLCKIPYKDFMTAITHALPDLMSNLDSDVRNVLLTLARIWSTVATDTIRSKPAAAEWVINLLPGKYHPVMKRAKAICKGEEKEHWDDVQELIKPCADFMLSEANTKITEIILSDGPNRSIKIA